VVAEGEHAHLEKLIAKLHKGSLFAHVDNVSVSWHTATNEFKKFNINFSK
jgi:acylphosphatase